MSKLNNVPFYGDLYGKPLSGVFKDGKQRYATYTHVLVYGAVVAHHGGKKGCIAGSDTIGNETGLTEGSAKNIISQLNAAGWVKVILRGGKGSRREKIEPVQLGALLIRLEEHKPSAVNDGRSSSTVSDELRNRQPGMTVTLATDDADRHSGMNIEDKKKTVEKTARTFTDIKGERPALPAVGEQDDFAPSVKPQYGDIDVNRVIEHFDAKIAHGNMPRLPMQRQAANTLVKRTGSVQKVFSAIDYVAAMRNEPYFPGIFSLEDLRDKWLSIESFGEKRKANTPVYIDADAELARIREQMRQKRAANQGAGV